MSGAVEDVELWIKGKPPEPNIKGAQLQYFEHLNVIKYKTSMGKHNMYCMLRKHC